MTDLYAHKCAQMFVLHARTEFKVATPKTIKSQLHTRSVSPAVHKDTLM